MWYINGDQQTHLFNYILEGHRMTLAHLYPTCNKVKKQINSKYSSYCLQVCRHLNIFYNITSFPNECSQTHNANMAFTSKQPTL